MKFYRGLLKGLLLAVAVLFSSALHAEDAVPDSVLEKMDSVSISLLTCTPGEEIWSLYGHTAIRYEDKAQQLDLAINYGVFDFTQKNFMLRFVFGRTDYQMGIVPMSLFMMEYASEGRGIIQQTLNLSRDEKLVITQALQKNFLPQNRVYRYNFFYDNCTTRARDILVNHLNGKVEYAVNPGVEPTYREMVHQWNDSHRWMSFGCDLLLGIGSDKKTDFAQQQFLPDSLSKDFDKAMVVEPTGHKHRLVSATTEILKVNSENVKEYSGIWNAITPGWFFILLFLVVAAVSFIEYRRKKVFWLIDVVLLTVDGLAGLVLFAMIFSYHPTVRVNLQILLLNPLSLCFVYSIADGIVKGRYSRLWNVLLACFLLSLIGSFFQHYAEGMVTLACTLLLRIIINRRIYLAPKKDK